MDGEAKAQLGGAPWPGLYPRRVGSVMGPSWFPSQHLDRTSGLSGGSSGDIIREGSAGIPLTLDFYMVSTLASISAFMPCLSFSSLDFTLCRFSACSVSSAMESVCFLRTALCRAASSGSRHSCSSSASRWRFSSIWGGAEAGLLGRPAPAP